ncbi:hypothetical protein FAZ69_26545 [Trinickia terrae]|uniref:Uncharacterized protein n=1 Tax=Trinickia terrae TaxID=2571161 RepID=A0A4U1HMV7_9BURK|nr:hypothetical protein FAZ69_26545 [Trinickia terrae]
MRGEAWQRGQSNAAQDRRGEGRSAWRAAAGRFHRLKSGCYTPTHSNKTSAGFLEQQTVHRHSWSSPPRSQFDRRFKRSRSRTGSVTCPAFVMCFECVACGAKCGYLSAHASSLWNLCASTTRSRVTSNFSCRAVRAKCECMSAG